MAAATDQQVQTFVNERFRPFAESVRAVYLMAKTNRAQMDDIYNALNVPTPTWADGRMDGPPHLLAPSDVLAWNSFMVDLIAAIEGNGQWPIIQKACVRGV